MKADEELHISLATTMQDLLRTHDPTKSTLAIKEGLTAGRYQHLKFNQDGDDVTLELRVVKSRELLERSVEMDFDL
jgi:hypothetical protein